jgi:hypothetical protein
VAAVVGALVEGFGDRLPAQAVLAHRGRSGAGPIHLAARRPLLACGHWSVVSGHTTAQVRLIDPPHIDGVETVAMAGDISTFAEGGTRIGSRAETFTAYLGDCWAYTTVVADLSLPQPALDPRFAAGLLW